MKVLEREPDPITIFHSQFSSLACNTPAPRPVETITTPTVHPKPFLSTLFFPSTDFVPLISQGWARSRLSPGLHSLPASTVLGSGQVVKYRLNDSIWDRQRAYPPSSYIPPRRVTLATRSCSRPPGPRRGGAGPQPRSQGRGEPARQPRLQTQPEAGSPAPTLLQKALSEIVNYFPIWKTSGKVVKSDAGEALVEEPIPSGGEEGALGGAICSSSRRRKPGLEASRDLGFESRCVA